MLHSVLVEGVFDPVHFVYSNLNLVLFFIVGFEEEHGVEVGVGEVHEVEVDLVQVLVEVQGVEGVFEEVQGVEVVLVLLHLVIDEVQGLVEGRSRARSGELHLGSPIPSPCLAACDHRGFAGGSDLVDLTVLGGRGGWAAVLAGLADDRGPDRSSLVRRRGHGGRWGDH
jgi:hypothetical protein